MRRRRRSDTSTRRDGTARRHPARVRGVLLGRVARPTTTKKKSFCSVVLACWGPGDPLLRELWTRTSGVWGDEQDIWQAAEASAEREVREQRSG